MKKMLKALKQRDYMCLIVAVSLIVSQVWLDLKMPDYMKEITTLVQTEGSLMSDILSAGGMMLLCALGSLAASVLVSVAAARVASDLGAGLRESLYNKVLSFSLEEISKFSTPSLITRTTNDVTQVQMLIVMGMQSIVKAPIMAVWAISKISGKSGEWTFSTAVAVVVLLIVVIICTSLTIPKFKKLQSMTDDLNRVTRENLNGLRVVKAYNAEEYQEDKFDSTNKRLTNTHLFTGRVMSFMMPGIQLVMNGLTLSIYWLGAYLINNSAMENKINLFSDMMVFSQYAMQVVMSFMLLVMIFIMLPRASVSAKRIIEVLNCSESITDGAETETFGTKKGEIEFKNVSFKYPDAEGYVIKNISFTALKGETVAFIGATGCGKSTLVNLIPRFYDCTEGEVTVDGINVKDYSQKALRNKIGYVSQKSILFSGTVKSNVAYGDRGSGDFLDSDIVDAVYTAQAADFVEKVPDKYDGYISQGGSNLSGGQKQRISIARAICRKPEILIFDDSFSALDYKTDRVLRENLNKNSAGVTKLIVAQRIGTIRDADRIIVLEDGEMVGCGKHDELMKNCEVYRQIAYSQLSKEELEK